MPEADLGERLGLLEGMQARIESGEPVQLDDRTVIELGALHRFRHPGMQAKVQKDSTAAWEEALQMSLDSFAKRRGAAPVLQGKAVEKVADAPKSMKSFSKRAIESFVSLPGPISGGIRGAAVAARGAQLAQQAASSPGARGAAVTGAKAVANVAAGAKKAKDLLPLLPMAVGLFAGAIDTQTFKKKALELYGQAAAEPPKPTPTPSAKKSPVDQEQRTRRALIVLERKIEELEEEKMRSRNDLARLQKIQDLIQAAHRTHESLRRRLEVDQKSRKVT